MAFGSSFLGRIVRKLGVCNLEFVILGISFLGGDVITRRAEERLAFCLCSSAFRLCGVPASSAVMSFAGSGRTLFGQCKSSCPAVAADYAG